MEVFQRVISALRPMVSFELGLLVVLGEGGKTVRYVVDRDERERMPPHDGVRSDWSSRLWRGDGTHVIDDSREVLEATLPGDAELLALGARALIALPFRGETLPLGVLVLAGATPGAFTSGDVERVAPFLDIVALAVEREQMWQAEQERHRRHLRLASLLPAIAGALDVRESFLELAAAVKAVVPHDILAFALVSPDGTNARVQAATDAGLLELPAYRYSNTDEAMQANWDFLLAYDLEPIGADSVRATVPARYGGEVVVRPGAAWVRFITEGRVRSTMRVPIRVKDRRLGGIAFFSRRPYAYHEEDAILGGRIADHVALALAHQEIADEERRLAQAEARAEVLAVRVDHLTRELARFSAHRALGESAAWKRALADATRVAGTDTTVLITGESGTGKEVLARYIHRGSPRANAPFVALNCAALPAELLESELFGHERGAFTGAVAARAGRIEQAAGGVLFLDEVGEMAPNVQAKFLRVLQEREFQRLGGTRTLKANVRIVAATNRDPKRAVEAGLLREDLYYRLGVFEIQLPPLRERPEDILVLAEGFLEEIGDSIGRPSSGISEDAAALLQAYPWPGNVRELRNTIERALILCHGGLITREHLPSTLIPAPAATVEAVVRAESPAFPLGGVQFDAVKRDLVEKALLEAAWNKSKAAKLLGLPRGQLYSLMRKYGLTDARR